MKLIHDSFHCVTIVIMRLRNPKTTGLIFASGKLVITGAKSEHLCQLAARKFARVIQVSNHLQKK